MLAGYLHDGIYTRRELIEILRFIRALEVIADH